MDRLEILRGIAQGCLGIVSGFGNRSGLLAGFSGVSGLSEPARLANVALGFPKAFQAVYRLSGPSRTGQAFQRCFGSEVIPGCFRGWVKDFVLGSGPPGAILPFV